MIKVIDIALKIEMISDLQYLVTSGMMMKYYKASLQYIDKILDI